MKRITCARPSFSDIPAILQDMERVLSSGRLMMGDYLQRFETDFSKLVGTKHAVAVNSCTTALEIVLRSLRLEGGEVIVPTNTFVATANAVTFAGGKPVLADTDPKTLCLSAREVSRRLTDATRVVILVHLGGSIAPDIAAIRKICRDRKISLIEDCAHAHGAVFDGRVAGSFGLAGCFSFYPTKIMTTAAGGMITTDDDVLAEYARSLRMHGRGDGTRGGLDAIVNMGNDWFLDELRCVLGVHQLRQLPAMLAHRRALAQRYVRRLKDVPGMEPVLPSPKCQGSFYKFMALLPRGTSYDRLSAVLLDKHGIETERLYSPPVHLQPLYRNLYGFAEGAFPNAEAALSRQICLPIHGGISIEDVDYVVSCLRAELKKARLKIVRKEANHGA